MSNPFETREYYDEQGRHITARVPLDGSPVLYTGYGRQQIKKANIDYFFDIEADDILEAFIVHDELSKAKWVEVVEQYKKDALKQQSRIKVASAVDEAIISGGNGRGIRMRK